MSTMENPQLDSYHSFLQSLIGEEVQVYKGGPEAKKGRLLDVQSDYITLLVQNNNENQNQEQSQNYVIYYRTEHLQSISENTKSNSMPRFQNQQNEDVFYHSEGNFFRLVEQLTGRYIQINQAGPESKTGNLLDISGNYMALLTEDDGVVYYNIHHIKSISESKKNMNEQNDNAVSQGESAPDFFRASDFHQLFGQMSHKWVSINRGGPEALEGVLVQSAGHHYTLINNDEVLRINPFHIKSISCGPKGAMKQTMNTQKHNNETSTQGESQESSSSSDSKSSSSGYNIYTYSIGKSSRKRSSSSSKRSSSSSSKRSSSSSKRSSSSSSKRSSSSSKRSSSSSSKRSSSSSSSSSQSSSKKQRGSSYERIVKTLDYIWNPKS